MHALQTLEEPAGRKACRTCRRGDGRGGLFRRGRGLPRDKIETREQVGTPPDGTSATVVSATPKKGRCTHDTVINNACHLDGCSSR